MLSSGAYAGTLSSNLAHVISRNHPSLFPAIVCHLPLKF